jgi:glycosyltransferase involved in cell wall biosynthesis
VESLAAGLPVIANLTSDLDKYLRDRFNGLIVRDCSISSLIDVLNYAINIDKCQIRMMHKNAYETAVHNFDFRLFSNDFSTFIRAIIDKG